MGVGERRFFGEYSLDWRNQRRGGKGPERKRYSGGWLLERKSN